MKTLVLALAASAMAALPAAAQTTPPTGAPGLITVSLENIRAEVAKNVNLDLEKVPLTIQLPVDVAASACGVSVNALSAQLQNGQNTCSASNVAMVSQSVTNTVN